MKQAGGKVGRTVGNFLAISVWDPGAAVHGRSPLGASSSFAQLLPPCTLFGFAVCQISARWFEKAPSLYFGSAALSFSGTAYPHFSPFCYVSLFHSIPSPSFLTLFISSSLGPLPPLSPLPLLSAHLPYFPPSCPPLPLAF